MIPHRPRLMAFPAARHLRLTCFGLALTLGAIVRGEVRWKELVVERTAAAGAKLVEFRFEFTNTGDHAVSVVAAKPSCGCTTIQGSGQTVYAPGQSGSIIALMDLSGKTADEEKTVTVTFSDALQTPALLTLRLHVARPVSLSAEELSWATGENPDVKTVTISLPKGWSVALVPLTKAQAGYLEAHVAPNRETGAHAIKVRPLDTSRQRLVLLRLNVTAADGTPQSPLALPVRIK